MKKCQQCNFNNDDNAIFCTNCGKRFKQIPPKNKINIWLILIYSLIGISLLLLYIGEHPNDDKTNIEKEYENIYFRIEADQPLSSTEKNIYEGNIDANGDKINYTIHTNADWVTQENLEIEIFRIAFYNPKSQSYNSQGTLSSTEEQKLHYIPPVCKIKKTDDRHFYITVDENEGTKRYICFQINLREQGENISSLFIHYYQQGKWNMEEEYTQKMGKEDKASKSGRTTTSSPYPTTHTTMPCAGCGGSGKCYNCNGSGFMITVMGSSYCPICVGSGKCPLCHGFGMITY